MPIDTLPAPRLLRAPRRGRPAWTLDADQRRVVGRPAGSGPVVVLGAPGTGRSLVLRELVAARVDAGLDPDAVLALAPTRLAADALRDALSARLARTTGRPAARTVQSYAFEVLRRVHVRDELPPPRLISGAEQDSILAELLAAHAEAADAEPDDGPDDLLELLGRVLHAPPWPPSVPRASWVLRSFRNEARDLLMRAVERGLEPPALAELGRRHGRPEWVAAAELLREYQQVNLLGRAADAYDPAGVVRTAVEALREDPELLSAERARFALVVVDDAHELPAAGVELLQVVAGGRDLLLTSDPDSVTQGFRGADAATAAGLAAAFPRPGGGPAEEVVLGTSWRQPEPLRAVSTRVAGRIGALGGVARRRAVPAVPTAPGSSTAAGVDVVVLASVTQEAAWIAQRLRRRHLLDGVPWSEMAIVVRSAGATAALRRALPAAGVPLNVPLAEVPLRDEPAVAPLLGALGVVLAVTGAGGSGPGETEGMSPDRARDLVTSPLGGADVVALRRLRQELRRAELAAGGGRSSDEVLARCLVADPAGGDPDVARLAAPDEVPGPAADPLAPARRVRAVLDAGRAALAETSEDSAEAVLWALWAASGLGPRWQRAALAGGSEGARADRDLDAVLALFEAAGRFTDRFPGPAGALRFHREMTSAEVPSDTLADRAPDTGAVTLTTPQGAAGREWDVVVVAGVQEGVWPDLRLRGSLLGAVDLVDVLEGRHEETAEVRLRAARRAVLDDELRYFHVAVSRARRELVVTAVRDEDERPSALLDLVDPRGAAEDEERPTVPVPRSVGLGALVARLRQVVCAPAGAETAARQEAAARELARLAAAGVPGADPLDWFGVPAPSSADPLRAPGELVSVSPSRVESFERCGLRWLLDTAGARPGDSAKQSLGNLVHQIAAELPGAGAHELRARLDRLWPSLGLPAGWVADRERQRAERMLDKLAEYERESRAEGRTLSAVEQAVDVVVGRARVRGRVDRLEVDALGRAVVVDLKTGKTPPKDADLARTAQLGVYQVAAEHGGFAGPDGTGPRVTGGAALVQLGGSQKSVKVQRQPPPADDEEPGWAAELLARAADGMAAAEFEAVVGKHCGYCPVVTSCPAHDAGRSVCADGTADEGGPA
ncbi:PD-(D/E)XK nuclease family protein [Kineococcus gynurae]|uniref:PD-(D/E)XK nuclease family protein n=1 Tax=Kineococcus gynurae TaxID=452979 RepID=UPI0036D37A31